jgi:GT2 family glycosyltransferase
MCRRADYAAAGGMNEYFATHYQDVDLCLRLADGQRRILCVPQARLYHFEGASRGCRYDYLDRLLLLDRWQDAIDKGDPYYNSNLSLSRLDYSEAELALELR